MVLPLALWATSPAVADPISHLAPGPHELGTAQAELTERLVAAEAMEVAVARIQSTLTTAPEFDDLCRDPLRAPLTVKLRRFATAWHDAAQRVRVQADRVRRIAQSPTVAPIIDEDRRAALDGLLERARKQQNSWLELVAWVEEEDPITCAVKLETHAGLPDPIVRARGEAQGAVAVLALEGGFVCAEGASEGIPTDDRVLILAGPACWSPEQRCACKPASADPGAVLGP